MKKFNQFDMEQQIMNCWNICEDLETLYEGVLDRDMSRDQISNVLMGMKDLYHLKFQTLFEHFEAGIKEFHEMKNPKTSGSGWPFPTTGEYNQDDDEEVLERDIRYSRMENIVDDN